MWSILNANNAKLYAPISMSYLLENLSFLNSDSDFYSQNVIVSDFVLIQS